MYPIEPADLSRKTISGDEPEPPADMSWLTMEDGSNGGLVRTRGSVGNVIKHETRIIGVLVLAIVITVLVGILVRVLGWAAGF